MRKLLILLGCPIDDLTMEETLDKLEEFIEVGRKTGKTHQITTVNLDFVVKALQDPELRLILQEADLSTADGMPIVWGAKLLGVPLRERVTGADLVPMMAERAAPKGYSMYFLGAAPGVAQRAADILVERYPGLKIAGVYSPPKGSIFEMDPAIVENICAAKPDMLFVAFGNPKQEKWINMFAKELSVPVMAGIGGTFDFIAGATVRAPEWMQKSGLEWFFRLSHEPRRLWKRYIVDSWRFIYFFVFQWWYLRSGRRPEVALPSTTEAIRLEGHILLNIRGRLDLDSRAAFLEMVNPLLAENSNLILDLSETTFLDSSGLGTLVDVAKRARAAHGDLKLVAIPEPVFRTFMLTRLDRFFEIFPSVMAALHKGQVPLNASAKKIGWQVAKIPRRLDADTSQEIAVEWQKLLQETPNLVLDFSDTVFLTSAGMAALLKLNHDVEADGGELRLAACQPDVQRVLTLTKLDAVLKIYASLDDALA